MTDAKCPITLQCKNHHQLLVKGLWNFVKFSHGVDFHRKRYGRLIRAHKLIMDVFMQSSSLYQLVDSLNVDEYDCLPALIEFLYRGKITLDKAQLGALLALAKKLSFKMLVEAVLSTAFEDQGETASILLHQQRTENLRKAQSVTDGVIVVTHGPTSIFARLPTTDFTDVLGELDDVIEDRQKYLSPPYLEVTHHVCNDCGRSFFEQSNLARHRRSHDVGVSPFGRSFQGHPTSKDPTLTLTNAEPNVSELEFDGKNYDIDLPELLAEPPPPEPVAVPLVQTRLVPPRQDPVAVAPEDLHQCDRCAERCFTTATNLRRHIETFHESDIPFKCDECAIVFKNQVTLTRHMKDSHTTKQFKCGICQKRFRRMYALRCHQNTHVSQRLYRCSLCPKFFSRNYSLSAHIRTHTEKVYHNDPGWPIQIISELHEPGDSGVVHPTSGPDDEQSAAVAPVPTVADPSPTGNSLPLDTLITTAPEISLPVVNSRPYLCSVCDKSFIWKHSLKSHELLHAEKKKYWCDDCGRGFFTAMYLKRHYRTCL